MKKSFLDLKETIVVLVAFSLAFLSVESSSLAGQSPTDSKELRVGLASVDVTPDRGVPLAGYGGGDRRLSFPDVLNRFPFATFFTPSEGVLDPIRAKTMVLKRGDQKLLFLSMDAVGVTADVRTDLIHRIKKKFGFGENEVFISATHTHSGPGAMSRSVFWSLIATDIFQEKIYNIFLDKLVLCVEKAVEALEPATLVAYNFNTVGIQKNRRGREGHFDPTTNLLFARSKSGKWLGGLVNVAVHGTMLGASNRRFSADLPGGMERAIQKQLAGINRDAKMPTILFVNGAVGDVTPADRGVSNILKLSESFADQVIAALPTAWKLEPVWNVTSKKVNLSQAAFNVRGCIKEETIRSLIFKDFRLWIGFLLPTETRVWNVSLGDLTLMTWPGEPTSSVGLALKDAATEAGARHSWVMGLTNDYLAYFTTEDEYHAATYEARSSLYGPEGAKKILRAHKKLLGYQARPSIVISQPAYLK